MKRFVWVSALALALLFNTSASATTYCQKANKEFKVQIKASNSKPGLTEKYAFLKKCEPISGKGAPTCEQRWELETFRIQELARRLAMQIVLNNKKCFSPTLVAQVQLASKGK